MGRGICVDSRMDLDAGRDADDGQPLADGMIHIAGRTVSTGEDQQIHAQIQHRPGCRFRVLPRGVDLPCGGPLLQGAHHHRGVTHFFRYVLTHLTRKGVENDLISDAIHSFQGFGSLRRRLGDSAQSQGFFYDLPAVTALEPDSSADPCQRIHDQPHFLLYRLVVVCHVLLH